jgi:hypothetical protein
VVSVTPPAALYTPGKDPPAPIGRLGGPLSWSALRLEEESFTSVGDRTPVFQSVVRHYTDLLPQPQLYLVKIAKLLSTQILLSPCRAVLLCPYPSPVTGGKDFTAPPNSQVEGPPLLGCPQLIIHYIHGTLHLGAEASASKG